VFGACGEVQENGPPSQSVKGDEYQYGWQKGIHNN
jgi:hypothetical protein